MWVRGAVRLLPLLAFAWITACGPGDEVPRLTDLRCAEPDNCQAREDPFRLRLAVDFVDADADLADGTWDGWVGSRRVVTAAPLAPLFETFEAGAPLDRGVLVLDVPVSFPELVGGVQFEASVRVRDGAGNVSNRPGMQFRLDLR